MRFILGALMLLAPKAFAARAIMEQTAASNNTIFVATQTTSVGIGNASPQATLDVTGTAQFGTTAKSTFTANGSLNLATGATLTVPGMTANSVVTTNNGGMQISLPQMGNGGLIIGTTAGVQPSTGTLTGTANEIGITNSAGKIVVGGAGQNVTCTANQALLAATWNHGIPTSGSCTTVSVTANNNPQPGWQGINYWIGGSSGTAVVYSTGATPGVTTGVDSFHVADSSWAVNGALCHTIDTTFTLVHSTISIAWLDTACGLHVSGIVNNSWVSLSSYTSVIGDGVPIVISTTGTNGDVHVFNIVDDQPEPVYAGSWATRGSQTNNITTTAGASPDPWWSCATNHNILESCSTNNLALTQTAMGKGVLHAEFSGTAPQSSVSVFIVNNIGSGSQNINISNYSNADYQASVDGNGLQTISNGTNSFNLSVGTGRHIILLQGGGEGGIGWNFPPNMKFVRPGPV